MLHAAAMLAGLFLLAVMLTAPGPGLAGLWAPVLISVAAMIFSLRFGGASSAFHRAGAAAGLATGSAARIVRGALKSIRGAAAADIMLRPALIRIRTGNADASSQARLAHAIGAAPGSIVVETDDEGLLVHVTDEDASETSDLGRIERRLSRIAGEGAGA